MNIAALEPSGLGRQVPGPFIDAAQAESFAQSLHPIPKGPAMSAQNFQRKPGSLTCMFDTIENLIGDQSNAGF